MQVCYIGKLIFSLEITKGKMWMRSIRKSVREIQDLIPGSYQQKEVKEKRKNNLMWFGGKVQ